jgi:hypothetical protein
MRISCAQSQSWRRGNWCAGLLALLFLGCGLADYESHIEKQRKRLDQIDLENKLIGDPVEQPKRLLPDRSDQPGLSIDFFLRAPRDLARENDQPPLDYPPKKVDHQVSLFRYSLPKSERIDGAAPEKRESPLFLAVLVTTAPLPIDDKEKLKESRDEFRKNVVRALFHHRLTPEELYKQVAWKKYQLPPHSFDTADFLGGGVKDKTQKETYQWHLSLFFHEYDDAAEARKIQSAIIFQVPFERKDDKEMRKIRDLSLRSFGVGEDYQNKVAQHTRWPKR